MKTVKPIFCLLFIFMSIAVPALQAQYVCQPATSQTMTGSITAGDLTQLGRITRDGKPSTCLGSGASLENNTILKRDSQNFTNPFSETVCVKVEVDFTGCGGNQTMSTAYSNYLPTQPANNVIGDMGYSTIAKGTYLFSVGPNANFTITAHEVEQNTGCPSYSIKVTYLRGCRQPGFDKTNDGRADIAIYRTSSTSEWWTLNSEDNQSSVTSFGTVGDIVTGGSDYTGDGKTDLSVYRPSSHTWYYGTNQDTPGINFSATQWGSTGDRPAPGDYDGDGKNDVAIWRESEGRYYVLRSSDNVAQVFQWGTTGDRVATGDFDGDTISDLALVRPTSGGLVWYVLKSNYRYGFDEVNTWGLAAGDVLAPADYDGDSVTDLAVWRESEGTFYIRRSSDLTFQAFKWGMQGDKIQPADYDGDKIADFAVFRPSTGIWYIYNSSTQTVKSVPFGFSTDLPVTAPYRVQ